MAGTKISALSSLAVVSDSTIFPVVDGGVNYKTTSLSLKTYIGTYGDSNVSAYLANNVPTGTYSNSNVAAYLLTGQIQPDWNQSTVGNVAYIKNKPDLSVYATTSSLSNYATTASLSNYATTASLSSYATTTSLQTLSANVGAFETYANATFSTSTYGNVQMLANLASTNPVTFGGSVTLGTNNKALNFKTTNGSNVTLIQQNDDNLVLYSTDASSAQRPIWSVFANSSTSSFNVSVPLTVKDVRDTVYTGGTTSGNITPDCANGDIQTITLTGSITLNGFANAVNGQSMTMIITQPSSGGPYTLTSTMKFANGAKTLSTAANAVDMLTISYIGGTYYASLITGFA